jgi:hypothetical protein
MTDEQIKMKALMESHFPPGSEPFKPCAFYQHRENCIWVVLCDCSFTEIEITSNINIWLRNHVDEKQLVGFTIEGARGFCSRLGIDESGIPAFATKLLDFMLEHPRFSPLGQIVNELRKGGAIL